MRRSSFKGFSKKNKKKLVQSLDFIVCYIDEVLSPIVVTTMYVDCTELKNKDTTDTARSSSFLDLQLNLQWGPVKNELIRQKRLPFKFFNYELFIYICRYHHFTAQGCGVYICQYMDIFQRLWFLSWIPWQRVSCWQGSYWTKGVNIFPHFPYWWLPIRFLIRVAPRVSLVEQELTHFPVFCEVFVAQYLGFLCSILKIIVRAFFFFFCHCIVWPSSIYGLWLSLISSTCFRTCSIRGSL